MIDRGIWMSWYDLPENGKTEYLSWLSESYIPRVLGMKGVLWAAHYAAIDKEQRPMSSRESRLKRADKEGLPAGDRYIMMFGAENAHVFGDPTPSSIKESLPPAERKILELRTGERMNIMTEASRVEGPEAASYQGGMALPPCIQLGNFNCDWRNQEEMLAWYTQWRLPACGKLTGIIRTRLFASIVGWAKHVVLYEWTSLEARNNYFPTHEDHDPRTKEWSEKVVMSLMHAPGSSTVAQRIWPSLPGR